jgi:hypothetical protein
VLHVTSFIEFISRFNVVHEDVMMKMFVCTLEDEVLEWFYDCSPKEISSLAGLIRAFCKHWDVSYEEKEESIEDYAFHLVPGRNIL